VDLNAIGQSLFDADGRWLILETTQALAAGDSNAVIDLYHVDLIAERIQLLSRTPTGQAGNGPSTYPAADASGELVVFQSDASDLVADDTNGVSDLFLQDRALGETTRLTDAEQASARPSLSADAAALVFDQQTADGPRQVFAASPWEPAITQPLGLAEDPPGTRLDNHHPAISADGAFVVYLEQPLNADAPTCQVHLYQPATGVYHRQACPPELAANAEQARPVLSPDGASIEWLLPGREEPLRLTNPLHEPSSGRR
jgi:Tol biopolymer transport system component